MHYKPAPIEFGNLAHFELRTIRTCDACVHALHREIILRAEVYVTALRAGVFLNLDFFEG